MNLLLLGDARSVQLQRMALPFIARGDRVIVTTLTPAEVLGAEVVALPAREGPPGVRFGRKVRLVRRITRDARIDVIHAHDASYGLLALAAGAVPKVLSVHESDLQLARGTAGNRLMIRVIARGVDRITSPASHVTGALIALGAKPSKIETFQYGVDLERFHPASPGSEPRGDASLRVISTRPLAPIHRVDLLLMALARLACRADLRVAIAGSGPDAVRLEHLAWSLQVDRETRFLGELDERGVARAFREADVYVSTAPSDGASPGLLEAMATGLLPVAADITASRAWIRDGENGLLFEPGSPDALAEALLRAVHDAPLRAKARETNPARIEADASLDSGIDRISAIYASLVRVRSSTGRA